MLFFPHFSIKATENLIFLCKIDFYFIHFATRENKAGEIKIDLTPKKSNILYT